MLATFFDQSIQRHRLLTKAVGEAFRQSRPLDLSALDVQDLPLDCSFGRWLAGEEAAGLIPRGNLDALRHLHDEFHRLLLLSAGILNGPESSRMGDLLVRLDDVSSQLIRSMVITRFAVDNPIPRH